MNRFTVEEINLMCVFEKEGRTELITSIKKAMPYIKDSDMMELSVRVLEKLEAMADEEFMNIVSEAAE